MGFYDDLKKPPKKDAPVPQFVLSDAERQELATVICDEIREQCRIANVDRKRVHCAYYVGRKFEPEACAYHWKKRWFACYSFASISDIHHPYAARHLTARFRLNDDYSGQYIDKHSADWTAAERDKILPLVRKELVAGGFPADVVSAHDDLVGAVGYGIFKRGGTPVYTIKADIRW